MYSIGQVRLTPNARKVSSTSGIRYNSLRLGLHARHCSEGEAAMSFYEKGPVRIHYEEAGSGFPLLIIAGGGLNSTLASLETHPFDPIKEFNGEYRCIAADLRNANAGQS